MRKILTHLATASVTLVILVGCDSGDTGTASGTGPTSPDPLTPTVSASPSPAAPGTSPAAPGTSPAAPGTSPAAPGTSPAAPGTSPAAPEKLKNGVKGPEVVALQQRLTALGYWNGKADGTFGALTQQAVYAVQKAAGLSRDGVVGPRTRQALDRGVRPKARSTNGRIIEINLKQQLLMLVDDGEISQVFNTATGSNERYEHDGRSYLADTPTGRFTVSRDIDGWRHGPLGPLWRPKYFNGGIAVHGAYSIPPYPASHGCARVSIAAMNWMWANDKLPLKTRVWVY